MRLPAPGTCGWLGERRLLGAGEHTDGAVVLHVCEGQGERRVKTVVDRVVHEPGAYVAVERGLELAVGAPERLDGAEGRLARLDADAVDELVEVHVGKRRRGLLDRAVPDVRAPREVAPELMVVHHVIGGEVVLERASVGAAVLVARHEAPLLDEQARVSPGAGLRTAGEGAHLADGLGQIARELRAAHEDGLAAIDLRAGEGTARLGVAGRDDLLDDAVDVRHVTSSLPLAP